MRSYPAEYVTAVCLVCLERNAGICPKKDIYVFSHMWTSEPTQADKLNLLTFERPFELAAFRVREVKILLDDVIFDVDAMTE